MRGKWVVCLAGFLTGALANSGECTEPAASSKGRSVLQRQTRKATSLQFVDDHRAHLDRHLLAMAMPVASAKAGEVPATLAALSAELEATLQAAHEEVTEGHVDTVGSRVNQTTQYDAWAASGVFKTVCETGFNAGHSALRFLAGSQANLFEFDLGVHNYSYIAKDLLTKHFPDRLHVEWGDSTQTLPSFRAANPETKCDLLIVDGGHDYSVAISDLKNFAAMASPEHVVAIDDTPCFSEWCKGPAQAWQELKEHGCLEETSSVSMGPDRGYSTGRYIPSCSYLA